MTEKYGLYVGINKHENAPLYGCVNDAVLMRKTDLDIFGFKKENTNLLLDEYANKANVIKCMLNYMEKAKKGDIIRWHFSTHGTQFPDTSGDEYDGVDEAIVLFCPPGQVWWKDAILRDDDFAYVIKHKMKSGVRLICTFDCCHTGTGLRMIGDTSVDNTSCCLVRYMPPPQKMITEIIELAETKECDYSKYDNKDKVQVSRSPIINLVNGVFERTFSGIYGTNDEKSVLYKERDQNKTVELKGDAILYSGCLSSEVSYDVTVGGIPQGAMSYGFVKAVNNLRYKYFTYQELYDEMISVMYQYGYYPQQHPQLELDSKLRYEKYLY